MTRLPDDLVTLAEMALAACAAADLKLATAESCTGGLVAACLTAVAGASAWVERGFVTYSNQAKTEMLGVPAEMLAAHGAVSPEVAAAMATGALAHSHAEVAVAITGIAGPGGGTPAKPVGLVYLAAARTGRAPLELRLVLPGDRDTVRHAATARALELLAAAAAG